MKIVTVPLTQFRLNCLMNINLTHGEVLKVI